MFDFEVTFEGIDEFRRDWEAAKGAVGDGVVRGVAAACIEGAQEARSTHHYKDKTGVLTGSIEGKAGVSARGAAEGEITARAAYASYLDEGTPAHIIRPKARAGTVGPLNEGQSRRKRGTGKPRIMLAWQPSPGEWHFARLVHHPGTRPDGFFGRAYLKAERVLIREIEASIPRAQALLDR